MKLNFTKLKLPLKTGKGLLTRLIFIVHGGFTVKHVQNIYAKPIFGLLWFPMCLMMVEFVVTTKYTDSGEWKRFCPSVFLYLLGVVPGIWLLHYDVYNARHLHKLQLGLPDCDHSETDINGTGMHHTNQVDVPLDLSGEEWTLALEQILLILLIVGRWLLPKGQLTRDELSQLLLVFLGEAADTLEFSLESLKEEDVVCNLVLIFIILSIWTVSLLQFCLIISSPDDSAGCCDTDILSLWISVALQDGPYLLMRLYLIIQFHLVDQMLLFFTCKNVLVVGLQLYRMIILRHGKVEETPRQVTSGKTLSPERDIKDDEACVVAGEIKGQLNEGFGMS